MRVEIPSQLRTRWYAVIVAGGTGSRFQGTEPKQFAAINGKPVLEWSIRTFFQCEHLQLLVVVSHRDWLSRTREVATATGYLDRMRIVAGGPRRQDSCRQGLAALPDDPRAPVLIHDAARPFASAELVRRVRNAVLQCDSVIPVVPVVDSIVQIDNGLAMAYPSREMLGRVQTPQGFRMEIIRTAHNQVGTSEGNGATDDGSLVLRAGYTVKIIEGETGNRKITVREDI